MYKFNIKKIIINDLDNKKEFTPKTINVIIGPNNSGKSRLLKEIRSLFSGEEDQLKIIDKIEYDFPETFSVLNESYDIQNKIMRDYYGNWVLRTYAGQTVENWDINSPLENFSTNNLNVINGDWKQQFERIIESKDSSNFFQSFGALFYQYLGTEERLIISKIQKNYGLDSNNNNFLSTCKFEEDLLKGLSNKIREIFNRDILLDTQTLGDRLVFRVGNNFDYIKEKFGVNSSEITKLLKESILDEQGDGLKSFVSTYLAINLKEKDILLLDEPEAFLHPPLARQMGEMIGAIGDHNKQIYIATHSVEILKGILSKSNDINIIRITQPEINKNEVTLINKTILKTILDNPLLRVSRVLEGLFCEKVVLTEAESDELIYQEIIEKIWPQSGLYFVHGQNKQTLAPIAELYENIGVPYEVIIDFDILRDSREFNKFLNMMDLDEKTRQKYRNYCIQLKKLIDSEATIEVATENERKDILRREGDKVYHKIGISFLDDLDKELKRNIEELLEEMHKRHLHILSSGELETILVPFGVQYTHKKNKWVTEAINCVSELELEELKKDESLVKFLERVVN